MTLRHEQDWLEEKTRPRRILLVEDNQVLREMIAHTIEERFNAMVSPAGTMADGIRLIDRCDVAILDIKLPDGDGIEIYRHIANLAPMMDVVFLTGYSSVPRYSAAIEAIGPARIVGKTSMGDPRFLDLLMHFIGVTRKYLPAEEPQGLGLSASPAPAL